MDMTASTVDAMRTAFSSVFNNIHGSTPSHWRKMSMDVKSTGAEEMYGWLSGLPQMREWIGERHIGEAYKCSFTIQNRKFESTIRVQRTDIEDDKIGIYTPQVKMMAHEAATHPDQSIFDLLKQGFDKPCFDGQSFFDTEHSVMLLPHEEVSFSNRGDGTSPMWFLFDTSKALKTLVFQTRIPYQFQQVTDDRNEIVFSRDEYRYGVRARINAGFGLWQLAFGSRQPLTAETYAAARAQMQKVRYEGGRIMGVMPNLMIVGPENEAAAHAILTAKQINGSDNIWADSCELLVTPHLAA